MPYPCRMTFVRPYKAIGDNGTERMFLTHEQLCYVGTVVRDGNCECDEDTRQSKNTSKVLNYIYRDDNEESFEVPFYVIALNVPDIDQATINVFDRLEKEHFDPEITDFRAIAEDILDISIHGEEDRSYQYDIALRQTQGQKKLPDTE